MPRLIEAHPKWTYPRLTTALNDWARRVGRRSANQERSVAGVANGKRHREAELLSLMAGIDPWGTGSDEAEGSDGEQSDTE